MITSGTAALDALLDDGLRQLQLPASPEHRRRCLDYVDLLLRWNRAYNLTAARSADEIITRHVLDSLSIAPYLHGRRILDIGTGAGFPGIPLALWYPEREFHLLDSNGKKMRFLFQVKQSLQLDNVTLHHRRAEQLHDDNGFDCIVTRAFASLADMLRLSAHLCAADGCFLAMKAEVSASEATEVTAPYTVAQRIDLQVPGMAAQRQVLRIVRDPNTPTSAGTSSQ